jgi:hypothetical protein
MSTPADIINRQIQDDPRNAPQEGPLEEIVVATPRLLNPEYFGIPKFLSEVNPFNFKLAKANKTLVQFFPNDTMFYQGSAAINAVNTSRLSFYCLAAEIPGRTLATSDINIHGPAYKTPNQSIYNEVTFTLLCDDFLRQKQIFDDWIDYINPKNNYTFKYRETYIGEVAITQFSDFEKRNYALKLMEAYPIDVKALTTDWGDKEYHKIQVTMTYRYWIETKTADMTK